MSLKAIHLPEYLAQLNVPSDLNLPWAHSTASRHIFDILDSNKLLAVKCNVFKDKLCYFFVGRPAYKFQLEGAPSEWQLPLTFVVRFQQAPSIKRVYPFDSGAFSKRKLPDYITAFKLDNFEVASDPKNAGRLISFFFRSPDRYFHRKAVGSEDLKEQFQLDMRHQEILALARLYLDESSPKYDDRSAAIEIQVDQDIVLTKENVLGVVLPAEYARTPGVLKSLKKITSIVETYDLLPLGTDAHYALVYEGVKRIYKKAGVRI